MKKIIIFLILISGLILVTNTANALSPNQIRQNLENKATKTAEIKEQIREKVKEKIASMPGFFKNFKNGRIAFETGELTAIDGNTLTVTKDGNIYKVLVDDKTQLRRKFWGKSQLSEFSVGDKLNVVGVWEDEAKTTIRAKFIKNISIQKRHGVFIGKVSNKSENIFSLETVSRGVQKVTLNTDTECTNRKMEKINCIDILDGHKIKVRGLWDSQLSTITEVTKVKDFSLPVIASPSAKLE